MKKNYISIAFLFLIIQWTGSIASPLNLRNSEIAFASGYAVNGIVVAGSSDYGSGANQLEYPTEVFVDASGNVYVGDFDNYRVQRWAPGASTGTTVAGGNGRGSAANQLNSAVGIFVDGYGNLYVADFENDRIQKYTPGASSGITVAGGNGKGSAPNQLTNPTGVYVDAAGNIFIADAVNNRIQKWAPGAMSGITVAGGNNLGSAANQFSYPYDVQLDAAGNMFISDQNNHRVQKWAPGATAGITVAGGNGRGNGAGQLNNPNSIYVDAGGNIFICDAANSRVQKWEPGATVGVTVAGGNGYGNALNQVSPFGVHVDAAGDLYVSDLGNARVLKFVSEKNVGEICPADLSFFAPSCSAKVVITWTEPRDTFPSSIQAPAELDPGKGIFTFMGSLTGHGYYKSMANYQWPVARDLASFLGGAGVNGHLATLSSQEENDLIYNKIKNTGYAPWIGLRNTGRPGRFRWVNSDSLSYTNWKAGEPNNAGGNEGNIAEPYVRLSDNDGKWNDQRDDNLPFIAEFEKPLIRHKQISGPKNGSSQNTGTYTVCYERTNLITNIKDTCCFNITVSCNTTVSADKTGTSVTDNSGDGLAGWHVQTSPNPSSDYFRIQLTGSNNRENINVQVSDITGRIVAFKNKLDATQTITIGSALKPGVYFIKVTQGAKKAVIKVIKQ